MRGTVLTKNQLLGAIGVPKRPLSEKIRTALERNEKVQLSLCLSPEHHSS